MKRRLLAMLISLVMVVTMVPSIALASGEIPGGGISEQEDDESILSDNQVQETNDAEQNDVPGEEMDPDSENAEIAEDEETVVSETSTTPLTIDTKDVSPYSVSIKQKSVNYKDVVVVFDALKELKTKASKVKINVSMTYDGNVTQEAKKTVTLSELSSNEVEMKFPNYGTFDVKMEFISGSKTVKTVNKTVDIVAEEYNIAPIVASFPVVYFSLELPNITTNANGDPVPTFVSLQRPDAYNWDKLPENVYWQPNLTKKQVETQTSFATKVTKFSDYVEMLYKANPDAKFNLYINDAYCKYILELFCANGIPEEQFTVTILSDGSGTYANYNSVFNVDNPQARYDEMAAGWEKAMEYAYKNKTYSVASSITPYYGSSKYATVIANEKDNCELWVGRKSGTYNIPDTAFTDKYINNSSKVIQKAMNSMLLELSESETKQFKELYNFNDQMFAAAAEQNKKVMMILGSRTTHEPNWGTFSAYAKFLQMQYGDEYVYYYKGHPATPTALYPDKQAELDTLGIIDVESSIAAELILFFYPDIYMAGYSSTTFQSVASDEMATGVFGQSKKEAANDASLKDLVSRDAFQFYMDQATDVSAYPGLNSEHENYVVDFQENYLMEQGGIYDVAVYDYTADIIYYFANSEEGSELVKVSMGEASGLSSSLSMKNNSIKLTWNEVPNANGYEIVYKSKYNGAEKTKVVTSNTYTFKNLKKGQTLEAKIRAFITVDGKKYYSGYSNEIYRFVNAAKCSTTLSIKKNTLTTKWNKVSTSYGQMKYRVYVSVNGGAEKKYTTTSLSKVFSNLNTRDTYEIKVRPMKVVGGKTYTGTYSNVAYRYVATSNINTVVSAKTSAEVIVKKATNTTGYEVVYAKNSAFSSSKSVKQKGASKTKVALNGLARKTKYYAKVRPYKIIEGKTYYGAYSSVRTFTTK